MFPKADNGSCLYPKGSKIASKREHKPGETRVKLYGMKLKAGKKRTRKKKSGYGSP